jgi:hypothetical protein
MHISGKEVERLVRDGGAVKVDYWVYDLFAERLEKMGFRHEQRIEYESPLYSEGSSYINEQGDKVVLMTNRLGQPLTVLNSFPSPEKPKAEG